MRGDRNEAGRECSGDIDRAHPMPQRRRARHGSRSDEPDRDAHASRSGRRVGLSTQVLHSTLNVRRPARPCSLERDRDPAGVRRGWEEKGGIRAPGRSFREPGRAAGVLPPAAPGAGRSQFLLGTGSLALPDHRATGSASVPTGGGRIASDRCASDPTRGRVPRHPSPTSAGSFVPRGDRRPPASMRGGETPVPHLYGDRDLFGPNRLRSRGFGVRTAGEPCGMGRFHNQPEASARDPACGARRHAADALADASG
ncbi:hypothetical protein LzC2_25250 [Planctomycetes bacterium LzC2]|uniref:Uncharacterized protein n=1 Tax=Alienimonas chondri TaxID=2681879 RepID=A0ABX1VEC6_9PLAN|nr:hypothetical protein [Alienimonas chondri]